MIIIKSKLINQTHWITVHLYWWIITKLNIKSHLNYWNSWWYFRRGRMIWWIRSMVGLRRYMRSLRTGRRGIHRNLFHWLQGIVRISRIRRVSIMICWTSHKIIHWISHQWCCWRVMWGIYLNLWNIRYLIDC